MPTRFARPNKGKIARQRPRRAAGFCGSLVKENLYMMTKRKKQAEQDKAPAPEQTESPTGAITSEENQGTGKGQDEKSPDPTPPEAEKNKHLADLRQENSRLQDRLLRLQADFDNHRRRAVRERAEFMRSANEALILELLPVIDHMELALDSSSSASDKPFVEGFRMVMDQMLSVLRDFSVEPMETVGREFDPNLHEAVSHVPDDKMEANRIIAQTRKGFMLGERLLRPPQVVVSSGPLASTGEEPAENNRSQET